LHLSYLRSCGAAEKIAIPAKGMGHRPAKPLPLNTPLIVIVNLFCALPTIEQAYSFSDSHW